MVSYKPLFRLLVEREMSKAELMRIANISPNTMTKIRRSEEVSMTILNKICAALNVTYGDIIDYIPEKDEIYIAIAGPVINIILCLLCVTMCDVDILYI